MNADLELQVLRARGWQTLPTSSPTRLIRIDWREPVLRAVLHPVSGQAGEPLSCHMHLQGMDRGWADVGHSGWRIYTHLQHGRHLLQIRAAPGRRRPVCMAAQWEVWVMLPPWRRWWAWLTYLGFGMGGIGASWRAGRWCAARPGLDHVGLTQGMADLGHELRTPLAGLLGMLELLAATPVNRRQQRFLLAMRQSGELLLRLIDDALRPMGRAALRPAPFAPEALCMGVLELMSPLAADKGLSLQYRWLGACPAMLKGDAARIEQLLLNLLGNAIKYTSAGEVGLVACWRAGQWWLWIHDTGPGIPETERRRVFRRFVRLPATAGSVGQGLGLAICRNWVRRMGGQITLLAASRRGALPDGLGPRSGAMGGTVARIRLPLPVVEAAGMPASRRRP